MKNVIPKIVFSLMLISQYAFAYPPNYDFNYDPTGSTFEIKSQGAAFITVSIDGDYFQEPVKHFSVSNIPPGNHRVEIFSERINHAGHYGGTQSIKTFSGNIYIKPSTLVKGVVDNFGRFYIKNVEELITCNNYYEPYYDPYYQPYYQPVYQSPVFTAPLAINDAAFNQLLNVISNQWYDDTRLTVALQAVQSNWFRSEQVARIMHEMRFEDTKLELAKAAYPKVTDKPNYFLVNKEFWFSSTVEELSNFVISFR